jgi:hypothetical protein
MATEQAQLRLRTWAWIVAFNVNQCRSSNFVLFLHGFELDLVTGYLLVLATGIVYGPLVLLSWSGDTTSAIELIISPS